MADKDFFTNLGSLLTQPGIIPVIIGGGYFSVLKTYCTPEADLGQKRKELSIKMIDGASIALANILVSITSTSLMAVDDKGLDQKTILRGDGMTKPDLCYALIKTLSENLERGREISEAITRYQQLNTINLGSFCLAIIFLFSTLLWPDEKVTTNLLAIILIIVQLICFYFLRATSLSIDKELEK